MNSANNPYSTYASNSAPELNMDITVQLKRSQHEEALQKSQRTLPFTGDKLGEEISQLFINLMKIKKTIDITSNEPNVDKQAIDEALEVIDDITRRITIDLPLYIDKLYL